MKQIKVIEVKALSFGIVEVKWEDSHSARVDLTEDLKKTIFQKITKNNFNDVQVLYDGCVIGWEDLDIEIGMSRWINADEKAA